MSANKKMTIAGLPGDNPNVTWIFIGYK